VRVLLATSWGEEFCGIKSHSEMLIEAVKEADPEISIGASAEALDPDYLGRAAVKSQGARLLHLNYHRALHSRWTPEAVSEAQRCGLKVVITFHDTFGELTPDQLSQDLCAAADAFIVHEPCQGLDKALYWRMGVPVYEGNGFVANWAGSRPVLGTMGFDFGWKNYDRLAEITTEVGWAFTIVAPEMSEARQEELRQKNPYMEFHIGTEGVLPIAYLRGCDASAWMYTCGNSGQSAAILQGIAARKPVYALQTCRQFRSLRLEFDHPYIRWMPDFESLQTVLANDPFPRIDPWVLRLADHESWPKLGAKYAALYRSLVTG
jgi:hypothetical protein